MKNFSEYTYDTQKEETNDPSGRTKFYDIYMNILNEELKINKGNGKTSKKVKQSAKKVRVDTLIKTVLRRMRKFYKKLIKFNTHRLVKQKIVTNDNIEHATMKCIKSTIFKSI